SLLQELMKSVLGDYYNIMSSATLQTSKASGADQSAASCHKKRLIVVSEPEKSDSVLKSSRIKEFTGNEAIAARALYSTTTLIENQGTYYMECNAIPKIDSPDEAITRRLFIVAFTSTFVSQERYDEISKENENRPDYDHIMQNYKIVNPLYKTAAYKELVRPAMFHLLLQYYQEYLKNPVLKSQNESESHNFTTEYLGETWDFNTYMANCYQKMDAKSLVSARETYANAKDFVENTCIRIDTKFYEEFYLTYDPDRKQFKNLQDLKDFIRVSREYKDYYKPRQQRIGKEYGYSESSGYKLGTAVLVGFARKKEESQAEKK
ncbi:hypothetical protein LLG07_06305, partial [bacterium]|nr:hypothetical protein [bacterium]